MADFNVFHPENNPFFSAEEGLKMPIDDTFVPRPLSKPEDLIQNAYRTLALSIRHMLPYSTKGMDAMVMLEESMNLAMTSVSEDKCHDRYICMACRRKERADIRRALQILDTTPQEVNETHAPSE